MLDRLHRDYELEIGALIGEAQIATFAAEVAARR